jgi:hypothetical protein
MYTCGCIPSYLHSTKWKVTCELEKLVSAGEDEGFMQNLSDSHYNSRVRLWQ